MTTTPLTDDELRAMREKAEKAGPCGAWFNPFRFRHDGHSDADASFIAACDPQTVLRLVDELERLRAVRESCAQECERVALRAEIYTHTDRLAAVRSCAHAIRKNVK